MPGIATATGAPLTLDVPGIATATGAPPTLHVPGIANATGAPPTLDVPGIANATGAPPGLDVPGIANATGAPPTLEPDVYEITTTSAAFSQFTFAGEGLGDAGNVLPMQVLRAAFHMGQATAPQQPPMQQTRVHTSLSPDSKDLLQSLNVKADDTLKVSFARSNAHAACTPSRVAPLPCILACPSALVCPPSSCALNPRGMPQAITDIASELKKGHRQIKKGQREIKTGQDELATGQATLLRRQKAHLREAKKTREAMEVVSNDFDTLIAMQARRESARLAAQRAKAEEEEAKAEKLEKKKKAAKGLASRPANGAANPA